MLSWLCHMCYVYVKALQDCVGKYFCDMDGADAVCIDKSKVCDGMSDCTNGKDEAFCGWWFANK